MSLDDFVELAWYIGPQLRGWTEAKLERWLGLQINRDRGSSGVHEEDLGELPGLRESPAITVGYFFQSRSDFIPELG